LRPYFKIYHYSLALPLDSDQDKLRVAVCDW
jgi:hypothetical protein